MAFLRSVGGEETQPLIRGGDLVLRAPRMSDYEAWAAVRQVSKSHLQPFEPQWASDELTRPAFRARVRLHQRHQRDGTGHAFFIFRDRDHQIIGGVTLANVRRGITQAASVGYWIATPFTRAGNMQRALRALLPYAFENLRLHRVEAACMPSNTASLRVLEAVGFAHEGLARRYLRINGSWQDHLLYALTEEDWRS